jgi:hypothetical protein
MQNIATVFQKCCKKLGDEECLYNFILEIVKIFAELVLLCVFYFWIFLLFSPRKLLSFSQRFGPSVHLLLGFAQKFCDNLYTLIVYQRLNKISKICEN